MARLPYLSPSELSAFDQDLLSRPINIFRVLAHSPGGLRAWMGFGDWIRHGSSIDPRLREMAILEVAVTTHNDYVFSHHVKIGHEFGVTSDDVALVAAWTPASRDTCPELEHAVLSAARQIAREGGLQESTWAVLSARLAPPACVDLLLTIGYYTMSTSCAAALAIEVEPEYEPFLVTHSDPRPQRPGGASRDELLQMLNAPPNWGRWGVDDQKGTINLINERKCREAAALVRSGTTVPLSRPFPTKPGPDNPRPATQALMRERKPAGGGATLEYIGLSYHGVSCTHVDALCHNWGATGMWGGKDPEEMLAPDGSSWGDIEQWREGIITRGVLLDIPGLRDVPYVEMDRPVRGSELDDAAERQSVVIGSGDAAIVYCGREAWDAHLSEPWGTSPHRPGLHASCLDFLARRDVAVLAWDMMDALPDQEDLPWSVHGAIFALGLALVDNCELSKLVDVCRQENRYEFMFVVSPLRIARGTGSPVNPLAVF